MATYLVGRDAPLRGLSIEFNAKDDAAMLQDESNVGVIKGGEWKANFGGQINVCFDNVFIRC